MQEKIVILDFGSQYTQLIARRVRELNVYCEIHPFNKIPELDASVRGVILSGSPFSVRDEKAPKPDLTAIKGRLPLLGVCYGAQYLAHFYGGEVQSAPSREYGRAMLTVVEPSDPLMQGVPSPTQVWMSHGDTITSVPDTYRVIASTEDVRYAAFRIEGERSWGIQFHPEVRDTSLLRALSATMRIPRALITDPWRTLLLSSWAFSSAISARIWAVVISLR